jgi:molybdopterin converting factor small subunit
MVPSRDTAHNQVFRSRGILVDVRVELLYFGVIKDILGRERETLELCGGAKVEDAIRLLRGRASNDTSRIWESMAVAINREYAGLPDVLRDGDELALLPPVSGGCVWETT